MCSCYSLRNGSEADAASTQSYCIVRVWAGCAPVCPSVPLLVLQALQFHLYTVRTAYSHICAHTSWATAVRQLGMHWATRHLAPAPLALHHISTSTPQLHTPHLHTPLLHTPLLHTRSPQPAGQTIPALCTPLANTSSTNTTVAASSSSEDSSNTGLIVGLAVGIPLGLLAIAGVAGGAWYYTKRRPMARATSYVGGWRFMGCCGCSCIFVDGFLGCYYHYRRSSVHMSSCPCFLAIAFPRCTPPLIHTHTHLE